MADNIEEDKYTRDLLSMMKKLVKAGEDVTATKTKEIRLFAEVAMSLKQWNKELEYMTIWNKERERHDGALARKQTELLTVQERMKKFTMEGKERIQKEHDQAVDRHIRLRHSLDQMNVSVGTFTKLVGGIGAKQGAGMMFGQMAGLVNTQRTITRLTEETRQMKGQYMAAEIKFKKGEQTMAGDDPELYKLKMIMLEKQGDLKGLQRMLKQEKGSPAGKMLEDSKAAGGFARAFEGLGNFLEKNKNGIIISAFSLGLFIGMLKKLLSVSPMLQKMLEVMNLAFNLILRPFGDFIGFFLRPIAMMMLATVMPFFKEAYPMLAELGTMLGEGFADWMKTGDIGKLMEALGFTFEKITPAKVLGWIFGTDREDNTEGAVGAIGGGLAAAGLGAAAGGVWTLDKARKWVMGKGEDDKKKTKGNKDTTSKQATSQESKKQGKERFKNLKGNFAKLQKMNLSPKMAGKVAGYAARFGMRAIPIAGWAMLAADLGMTAVKALNPEAYAALREGSMATFGDDVGGFLVPETTIGEDVWNMGQALSGGETSTSATSGGDTFNVTTVIGEVKSDVDLNEVTNSVEQGMQKSGKSRYG